MRGPAVTLSQISSCCAASHWSTLDIPPLFNIVGNNLKRPSHLPFLLHIVERGTCLFMCAITRRLHTGYL